MKSVVLILLLSLLSSCNPVASGKKESRFGNNFKPGLPPTESDVEEVPQAAVGSATGFKVTPGVSRMAGDEGSAKATILLNDRMLVGTNISGRFSINKTRVR